MPEYRSPGVYIEEVPSGPVPIQGVSTHTTGFVGCTERGPLRPTLVTSWLDFERRYGGPPAAGDIGTVGYLAYAVRGFFENGGRRAYIARVTDSSSVKKVARLVIGSKGDNLSIRAIGPGNFGGNILVKITGGSNGGSSIRISLVYYKGAPDASTAGLAALPDPDLTESRAKKTYREPTLREIFDNLSLDPNSPAFVINVINSASHLIEADVVGEPAADKLTGAAETYQPLTIAEPAAAKLPGVDNYTGVTLKRTVAKPSIKSPSSADPDMPTGLEALAAIDDISLLVIPDQGMDDLYQPLATAMNDFCDRTGHCFAIAQFPKDAGPVAQMRAPVESANVAIYFPWLTILDFETGELIAVPPGGHIAGLYARTDIERGVHQAPANEALFGPILRNVGSTGPLTDVVSEDDQEILNPIGINCIRDFRSVGRGVRVWGARTTSADGEWRYVPVRRLYLYLRQSLEIGTQWVVFEPNDEPTWARVVASVSGFLTITWRNGALRGSTPDQAFFVRCDRTTMTQDDLDNGRLNILVGIAPVKPAEFVIFRIGQRTADAAG